MNEIEKAAEMYIEKCIGTSFDGEFEKYKTFHTERLEAFKAGHAFALSMATDSFEEWAKNSDYSDNFEKHSGFKGVCLVTWQAARLSCAKELAEKNREIEELKEDIKILSRCLYVPRSRFDWDKIEAVTRKHLNNGGQG